MYPRLPGGLVRPRPAGGPAIPDTQWMPGLVPGERATGDAAFHVPAAGRQNLRLAGAGFCGHPGPVLPDDARVLPVGVRPPQQPDLLPSREILLRRDLLPDRPGVLRRYLLRARAGLLRRRVLHPRPAGVHQRRCLPAQTRLCWGLLFPRSGLRRRKVLRWSHLPRHPPLLSRRTVHPDRLLPERTGHGLENLLRRCRLQGHRRGCRNRKVLPTRSDLRIRRLLR